MVNPARLDSDPIKVNLKTQGSGMNIVGDVAGSLLGGALSYFGAREANKANKKMAREQMDFQHKLAREQMTFQQLSNVQQMDYQERMSNTAYQRAMADMRAAGLNPILAYNQGGASSPGGASSAGAGGSGSSANMVNAISGALSSAIEVRRARAEVENLRETNKLIREQARTARSQSEKNEADSALAEQTKGLTAANTAKALLEVENFQPEQVRKWVDTIGDNINPLSKLKGIFKK